jgi:hypothetical protein
MQKKGLRTLLLVIDFKLPEKMIKPQNYVILRAAKS